MKNRQCRAVLLLSALLLVLMGVFAARCPQNTLHLQAVALSEKPLQHRVNLQGQLLPATQTLLCPQKTAVVSGVYAEAGQQVKQGDLLCTLSPAISPTHIDSSALFSAVQSEAAQSETVTAADATVLRAPQDGTLLWLPSVGSLVPAGLPCLAVSDLQRLCVKAEAGERLAAQLCEGQSAALSVSALPDLQLSATVTQLARAAHRPFSVLGEDKPATVSVWLSLDEGNSALRSGYTVTASVLAAEKENALILPYAALCGTSDAPYLYCYADGVIQKREISLGYALEQGFEVVDGIESNALVLLSPPERDLDGLAAEVTE